uniref:Uncharacterized protein n=1 Tax=Arundo donax TaxID=35708 RepID=A0A0A9B261_ARUDO
MELYYTVKVATDYITLSKLLQKIALQQRQPLFRSGQSQLEKKIGP